MIYIKLFESDAAYDQAGLNNELLFPNVSHTIQNNHVFYNPISFTPSSAQTADTGVQNVVLTADSVDIPYSGGDLTVNYYASYMSGASVVGVSVRVKDGTTPDSGISYTRTEGSGYTTFHFSPNTAFDSQSMIIEAYITDPKNQQVKVSNPMTLTQAAKPAIVTGATISILGGNQPVSHSGGVVTVVYSAQKNDGTSVTDNMTLNVVGNTGASYTSAATPGQTEFTFNANTAVTNAQLQVQATWSDGVSSPIHTGTIDIIQGTNPESWSITSVTVNQASFDIPASGGTINFTYAGIARNGETVYEGIAVANGEVINMDTPSVVLDGAGHGSLTIAANTTDSPASCSFSLYAGGVFAQTQTVSQPKDTGYTFTSISLDANPMLSENSGGSSVIVTYSAATVNNIGTSHGIDINVLTDGLTITSSADTGNGQITFVIGANTTSAAVSATVTGSGDGKTASVTFSQKKGADYTVTGITTGDVSGLIDGKVPATGGTVTVGFSGQTEGGTIYNAGIEYVEVSKDPSNLAYTANTNNGVLTVDFGNYTGATDATLVLKVTADGVETEITFVQAKGLNYTTSAITIGADTAVTYSAQTVNVAYSITNKQGAVNNAIPVNVTVVSGNDYLSAAPTASNGTLSLPVVENTNDYSREIKITLSADGVTSNLFTLTQAKGADYTVTAITVDDATPDSIVASGGTATVHFTGGTAGGGTYNTGVSATVKSVTPSQYSGTTAYTVSLNDGVLTVAFGNYNDQNDDLVVVVTLSADGVEQDVTFRQLKAKESSTTEKIVPNGYSNICLYDTSASSYVFVDGETYHSSIYPTENYVPVGVVAVPKGHCYDFANYDTGSTVPPHFSANTNAVRIISLRNMDLTNPTVGTTDYSGSSATTSMMWGPSSNIADLYDYANAVTVDPSFGSTSYGLASYPYLPSDVFKSAEYTGSGVTNYIDTGTCWSGGSNMSYAPSPYASDGTPSAVYHMEFSGQSSNASGNALADMDGRYNTNVIWNLAATSAKTANTVANATQNYPAGLCCRRYGVVGGGPIADGGDGQGSGNWYLPSMGELGYVMARLGAINHSLCKLNAPADDVTSTGSPSGTVAVAIGDWSTYSTYGNNLWSSCEYSQDYARSLTAGHGHVSSTNKDNYGTGRRVRAFLSLGALDNSPATVALSNGGAVAIPADGGDVDVAFEVRDANGNLMHNQTVTAEVTTPTSEFPATGHSAVTIVNNTVHTHINSNSDETERVLNIRVKAGNAEAYITITQAAASHMDNITAYGYAPICLYNTGTSKYQMVDGETYTPSKYTGTIPVGVLVVPSGHGYTWAGTGSSGHYYVKDNTVRIISTKNMSLKDPSHGTTAYTGDTGDTSMMWGAATDLTNLFNYSSARTINPGGSIKDPALGTASYPYLPSDTFASGHTNISGGSGYTTGSNPCKWDTGTAWYTGGTSGYPSSGSCAPSPYNETGGPSTYYHSNTTAANAINNALADMDGLRNTHVISSAWTKFGSSTGGSINTTSYYPAAQCCRRYGVVGTPASGMTNANVNTGSWSVGDTWYLPSMGELGYLMARLGAVNHSLMKLNGWDGSTGDAANKLAGSVAVTIGDWSTYSTYGGSLWSSCELSQDYARFLYTDNGHVYSFTKDYNNTNRRVRAFLSLNASAFS